MQQPHVYYISQGSTAEQHLEHIKKMVDAGVNWVQLRLKNTPKKQWLQIALDASAYCRQNQVHFIVNDDVEIAKAVDATGVHLGKADQDPIIARSILGSTKLIGGTANTWEDCKVLMAKKVDYIGLGPLRYTTTKKNLSPFLGLESYHTIVEKMQLETKPVPIIAIGGITLSDIAPLRDAGVWGIALSGSLHQDNNYHTIQTIQETFKSTPSNEY